MDSQSEKSFVRHLKEVHLAKKIETMEKERRCSIISQRQGLLINNDSFILFTPFLSMTKH